jgi:hypothetical protein
MLQVGITSERQPERQAKDIVCHYQPYGDGARRANESGTASNNQHGELVLKTPSRTLRTVGAVLCRAVAPFSLQPAPYSSELISKATYRHVSSSSSMQSGMYGSYAIDGESYPDNPESDLSILRAVPREIAREQHNIKNQEFAERDRNYR